MGNVSREIKMVLGGLIAIEHYPSPPTADVSSYLEEVLRLGQHSRASTTNHVTFSILAEMVGRTTLLGALRPKSMQRRPLALSPGLAASFEDAFSIRRRTGGKDEFIGARHVLVAIATARHPAITREVGMAMGSIGSVDVAPLVMAYARIVLAAPEANESLPAWAQIFRERGFQAAASLLSVQASGNLVGLVPRSDGAAGSPPPDDATATQNLTQGQTVGVALFEHQPDAIPPTIAATGSSAAVLAFVKCAGSRRARVNTPRRGMGRRRRRGAMPCRNARRPARPFAARLGHQRILNPILRLGKRWPPRGRVALTADTIAKVSKTSTMPVATRRMAMATGCRFFCVACTFIRDPILRCHLHAQPDEISGVTVRWTQSAKSVGPHRRGGLQTRLAPLGAWLFKPPRESCLRYDATSGSSDILRCRALAHGQRQRRAGTLNRAHLFWVPIANIRKFAPAGNQSR
ncbi:hypothetical protein LPJGGPFB_04165 [Ensifer adhaerens]|nr:hypothetical protein [Ensifer adhaerens]